MTSSVFFCIQVTKSEFACLDQQHNTYPLQELVSTTLGKNYLTTIHLSAIYSLLPDITDIQATTLQSPTDEHILYSPAANAPALSATSLVVCALLLDPRTSV